MENKCVFSSVEKLLLLALSVSGLSLVSTDTVRRYHYVDTEYSWLEAQTHCREKFVDLATVKDRGDNDRLLKALQGRQGYAWIGLQDDLTKWTWTNMSFSDEKYSNWESEDDDDESNVNLSRDKCILMKTSGIWVEETCGKELFSVCYDEEGPDRYVVVNKTMQWKYAKRFCLDHHTHLVAVRNSSENKLIASLLPADAWIGLSRWSWKRWSDRNRVTFTNWGEKQPDTKEGVVESCVAVDVDAVWWDDECNLRRPFVCYSIQQTKSVRVKLKFRSEADLMDPAVSQQLLEQIRVRLAKRISEFDIKWMEKDGSIFHKESDETGKVVDLSNCAGKLQLQ